MRLTDMLGNLGQFCRIWPLQYHSASNQCDAEAPTAPTRPIP